MNTIYNLLCLLNLPGLGGGGGTPAPPPPPAAPPPPATPVSAKQARAIRGGGMRGKARAANIRNQGGGSGLATDDVTTTGKKLTGQ